MPTKTESSKLSTIYESPEKKDESPEKKDESSEKTPFNIKNLNNLFNVMCFLSPLIVILFFIFFGIINSNFSGLLYLAAILVSVLLRFFIYKMKFLFDKFEIGDNCHLINYTSIGSGDIFFSMWVYSFTLLYIIIPLIKNNQNKFVKTIIGLFVFFIVGDIILKMINKCYTNEKKWVVLFQVSINILIGGLCGLSFALLFSSIDWFKDNLFFLSNKNSSETCKVVDETEFQCTFDFE